MNIVNQIWRSAVGSYGAGIPGKPKQGAATPLPVAEFKRPKVISTDTAKDIDTAKGADTTKDHEASLPLQDKASNIIEDSAERQQKVQTSVEKSSADQISDVGIFGDSIATETYSADLQEEGETNVALPPQTSRNDLKAGDQETTHLWNLTTQSPSSSDSVTAASFSEDVASLLLKKEESQRNDDHTARSSAASPEELLQQSIEAELPTQSPQMMQGEPLKNVGQKKSSSSAAQSADLSKKVELTIGTLHVQVLPAEKAIVEDATSRSAASPKSVDFASILRRSGVGRL